MALVGDEIVISLGKERIGIRLARGGGLSGARGEIGGTNLQLACLYLVSVGFSLRSVTSESSA